MSRKSRTSIHRKGRIPPTKTFESSDGTTFYEWSYREGNFWIKILYNEHPSRQWQGFYTTGKNDYSKRITGRELQLAKFFFGVITKVN